MKPKRKTDSRKIYVLKKYVMARSAAEAMKLDRKAPVDSVWIDDDWANGKSKPLADAIGFTMQRDI